MALAALELLHLVIDKQIEHSVAVGAAKAAVLHKIVKAGAAGRADHPAPYLCLLLVVCEAQKPGKQTAQGEIPVNKGRVLSEIHLPGAVGAEIVLRLHSIDNFCIFNIGFPDLTSFT